MSNLTPVRTAPLTLSLRVGSRVRSDIQSERWMRKILMSTHTNAHMRALTKCDRDSFECQTPYVKKGVPQN